MKLSFKIANKRELTSLLQDVPKKLQTRGRIVMGRNAGIIARRVEATAPRDTDFMAEHVEIVRTDNGLGFEVGWYAPVFLTESESKQFYPPHVEYGTEWTPAQPSLGPAYIKQEPVIVKGVRRIMEDIAEFK